MTHSTEKQQNIYLIGPMGSGKTAVGRRLAAHLQLEFYDSDDAIESRTGVDIALIFEKEGEAGFRRREVEVIEELSELDGIVLATGGGSPVDPLSRELLASRGSVVYLYTTVPEQLKRTARSTRRPLLQCDDPAVVLNELMEQRDPLYREIADLVVKTNGRRVTSVVNEIEQWLQTKE